MPWQTYTLNGEVGQHWSGRHSEGSLERCVRAANIISLTLSHPVWQSARICVYVCASMSAAEDYRSLQ